MIKLVCFDIDGVLTNGMVHIDHLGNEFKSFRLTEIDALNSIKSEGFFIGAITGEMTPIVRVFLEKIKWDDFHQGCRDKLAALKECIRLFELDVSEVCYIGDGKYDIPAVKYAGLGVCPSNAIQEAKDAADIVLEGAGGESCIYELYHILKKMKEEQKQGYERGYR